MNGEPTPLSSPLDAIFSFRGNRGYVGKIPFEQPGRHRRIRLDDLLAYRDQRRQKRSEALDELVRQTEALGLYDEEAPEAR